MTETQPDAVAASPPPDARKRRAAKMRTPWPPLVRPRLWLRALAVAFSWAALGLVAIGAPLNLGLGLYRDQIPARWDPYAPLDLRAPYTFVQGWKIEWLSSDLPACNAALASAGAVARPRDDFVETPNCGQRDSVMTSQFGHAQIRDVQMRCGLALALYKWEQEVLQPAAETYFGARVAEILHVGSYNCRRIAGSSFWSQHARGNAFDISGFRFEDGRTVMVTEWDADAQRGAFLRAVHQGACRYFRTVLGPDADAAHYDHFHVDLGVWTKCR